MHMLSCLMILVVFCKSVEPDFRTEIQARHCRFLLNLLPSIIHLNRLKFDSLYSKIQSRRQLLLYHNQTQHRADPSGRVV